MGDIRCLLLDKFILLLRVIATVLLLSGAVGLLFLIIVVVFILTATAPLQGALFGVAKRLNHMARQRNHRELLGGRKDN